MEQKVFRFDDGRSFNSVEGLRC